MRYGLLTLPLQQFQRAQKPSQPVDQDFRDSCFSMALDPAQGPDAASDAFFPFVDGIEKLIQSGVKAVIQPSGSINDKEIIKFANETNTVLVFSKTRHFRH